MTGKTSFLHILSTWGKGQPLPGGGGGGGGGGGVCVCACARIWGAVALAVDTAPLQEQQHTAQGLF